MPILAVNALLLTFWLLTVYLRVFRTFSSDSVHFEMDFMSFITFFWPEWIKISKLVQASMLMALSSQDWAMRIQDKTFCKPDIQFILSGDFNQFGSIWDNFRGCPVHEDAFANSSFFRDLAGCNRLVLTECHRSDAELFHFYRICVSRNNFREMAAVAAIPALHNSLRIAGG